MTQDCQLAVSVTDRMNSIRLRVTDLKPEELSHFLFDRGVLLSWEGRGYGLFGDKSTVEEVWKFIGMLP
jgi:sensor histidine kinase regulating citrate/malate metabolism